MTDFTFYGDLLGVGSAYQLSAQLAHEKLNDFYNTVFSFLFEKTQEGKSLRVYMFSDSILIYGHHAERILPHVQQIYLELFRKGLLLRGATVEGYLRTQPRLEGANFRKFLPKNDTLARAVGLEKTYKGARFLLAPKLAECLLLPNTEWLTADGYLRHPKPAVPATDFSRRICPTPSGTAYEVLYFWDRAQGTDYEKERALLNDIAHFVDGETAHHYQETIGLLSRSELREIRTRELLTVI